MCLTDLWLRQGHRCPCTSYFGQPLPPPLSSLLTPQTLQPAFSPRSHVLGAPRLPEGPAWSPSGHPHTLRRDWGYTSQCAFATGN